jgi:hypothetical protein
MSLYQWSILEMPPDHGSERGRATSVNNTNALGRPLRSVLALGVRS